MLYIKGLMKALKFSVDLLKERLITPQNAIRKQKVVQTLIEKSMEGK
jgi:hypothetical protein